MSDDISISTAGGAPLDNERDGEVRSTKCWATSTAFSSAAPNAPSARWASSGGSASPATRRTRRTCAEISTAPATAAAATSAASTSSRAGDTEAIYTDLWTVFRAGAWRAVFTGARGRGRGLSGGALRHPRQERPAADSCGNRPYPSPRRTSLTSGDPVISSVMRGILRQQKRPVRPAAALTSAELRPLLLRLGDSVAGTRDRALLLIGLAGALRRSELVAIDHEDLRLTPGGLRLTIRSSKTDQEGKGAEIGIPRGSRITTCPVRALDTWLRMARIEYGPVFRRLTNSGTIESRLTGNGVWKILRLCGPDAVGGLQGAPGRAGRSSSSISARITAVSESRADEGSREGQGRIPLRPATRCGMTVICRPACPSERRSCALRVSMGRWTCCSISPSGSGSISGGCRSGPWPSKPSNS